MTKKILKNLIIVIFVLVLKFSYSFCLNSNLAPISQSKKSDKKIQSLKREFSKKLAKELRKETSLKLKKVKNFPLNYKNAIKNTKVIEFVETKDLLLKMKKQVINRIFNSREYQEKNKLLQTYLNEELKTKKQNIISEYEAKFKEILENTPLTEEEKKKYLSVEEVTKMSLDDYLLVLSRLSGNFVSHVTRYGIREQTFHEHETHKGSFTDEFIQVLNAKNLNSFFLVL